MNEATRILAAVERGDLKDAAELLPIVYQELRALAERKLAREPRQTLQATALVHEAYLRLVGGQAHTWDGLAHFFAAAAEAMRRILIDRARARGRDKRGGQRQRVRLDEAHLMVLPDADEVLALDQALTKLAAHDPVKADLVKLRYFAGLSMEAAARLLGISRATAHRYWTYTRAWLYLEIHGEEGGR